MPEPFVDEFFPVGIFFEDLRIGSKLDISAVGLFGLSLFFVLQNAFNKAGFDKFSISLKLVSANCEEAFQKYLGVLRLRLTQPGTSTS